MTDFDRDLRAIHEARMLTRAARSAQEKLETFSQEQIDAVVEAMAAAGLRESEQLAQMAVDETGYGRAADKVAKNNFVLENVVAAMRGMRTVGVVRELPEEGIVEIAEPVGVVAGIIPTTNPTSTALFKSLIAIKARCGIVMSPHPNARACIKAAADVMHEAAVAAGAPRGIIGCSTVVSMEGTQELMRGEGTDLILATGGMAMVKSAYSAGKPAYGVGPGNVPAYIERSADVERAVRDIISGTTFDNGTLCSSEQAIVYDREVHARVLAAIENEGGRVLNPDECDRLATTLITERLRVNTELVGQTAARIAEAAGILVPDDTTVLVCPQGGVGPDFPLSHEKLSPVLALYQVDDWREGCERCKQLLQFGGLGHTMVIHSENDDVVLEFGLYKPAHRILVNTVAAVGAVGLTTNLFPSMTLGCGSWGNNSTSDNIGPQHLLHIKRLARGVRPFQSAAVAARHRDRGEPAPTAPPQARTAATSIGDGMEGQVEDFLRARGIISAAARPGVGGAHHGGCGCDSCEARHSQDRVARSSSGADKTGAVGITDSTRQVEGTPAPKPVDFVAEFDVRQAIDRGEAIRIGPRTIITPLANDLGKEHGIFRRR